MRYIDKGYIPLIMGVAISLFFLYDGLTKEKITSSKDLFEIEGNYSKHSFKDNKGFRNFTHQYYIWTDNYKNAFQIPADYLRLFNKKEFASKVKQGAKLKLTIPTRLVKSLNSEKNIIITSLVIEGSTYLNVNEILKIEKKSATSNTEYYFGIASMIAGILGYLREKSKSTTANHT